MYLATNRGLPGRVVLRGVDAAARHARGGNAGASRRQRGARRGTTPPPSQTKRLPTLTLVKYLSPITFIFKIFITIDRYLVAVHVHNPLQNIYTALELADSKNNLMITLLYCAYVCSK